MFELLYASPASKRIRNNQKIFIFEKVTKQNVILGNWKIRIFSGFAPRIPRCWSESCPTSTIKIHVLIEIMEVVIQILKVVIQILEVAIQILEVLIQAITGNDISAIQIKVLIEIMEVVIHF